MQTVRTLKAVRTLAAVALVAAGVLSGAPAAVAFQEQAAQEGQGQPELAPVMLVLDASGSMKAADPSGLTKMQAAKAAVRLLMEEIPAGAQIGLTVYGTGTGNSEAEKAAGCQDVKVLHEVGELDRAGITRTAEAIRPSGYTPVGRSLQVAADALPQEGPRSIVLVSDGIDTCAPPDPCEIAGQLAQQGVDLRVHTVGFDVDAQAKQQLTCIAEATGGTYTDAADAKELGSALSAVTATALRGYEAVGTPVQGGSDQAGAPPLQPGAYLDHIDPGEALYYSVEVKPGYTLYATATTVFLHDRGALQFETLDVDVYAADGSECHGDSDFDTGGNGPMLSVALTYSVDQAATGQEEDPCDRPGLYAVRVARDQIVREADVVADLELLIGLEPPLAGDAPAPPAAEDDVVAFTDPGGQPTPVRGGGSFSSAATLPGSGRYTDSVQLGEFVFYRLRLEWGQGFAFQVNVPDGEGFGIASDLSVFWYSSQREQQDRGNLIYDGQAGKLPEDRDAFATLPVRYVNREVDRQAVSVAGWYYIAIEHTSVSGDDNPPIPVTIDLSVVGEPQPGPRYAGAPANGGAGGTRDPFGGVALGTEEPTHQPTSDAAAAGGAGSGGGGGAGEGGGTGPLELVSQGGPLLWGGAATAVLLVVALVLTVRGSRQRR